MTYFRSPLGIPFKVDQASTLLNRFPSLSTKCEINLAPNDDGGIRVAKFAYPRVLDDQKLSEDNPKLRYGCPPDYQIFFGFFLENSCPYTFFEVFILTLSFSNKHIPFWELKTNRILYIYGIKMRATKNVSRTTRFSILVVLRLPTFDSNFATLGEKKKKEY